MPKRVIILGSSGMAGHILTLILRKKPDEYDIVDVSRSPSQINPIVILDATDFQNLEKVIVNQNPDIIINCIGLLNREADNYPDKAILVNSYLPHFLEMLSCNTKCRVIHISTDCVFSGAKGKYKETDFKDGKGFYAQSKALGEIINSKDLTIRTSIVGPELKPNGTGLFHWFSQQRGCINGFTKAYWSGITSLELAKAIVEAINQNVVGLYHLTHHSKISKFELLQIFKKYFNDKITILPSNQYIVDKSLVNSRSDFIYNIPSYDEMISDMNLWMHDNRDIYLQYLHLLR